MWRARCANIRPYGDGPKGPELMSQTLYEDDIVLWSEQQADLIRRLAAWRRDLPNQLDIENVAEEIESVGRSETASVESFVRLLLLHLIKISYAPNSPAVPHWREEVRNYSAEALTRFAPSMGQRIRIDRPWCLACEQALAALVEHGDPSPSVPGLCPFSIEELIRAPLDIDALLARLGTGSIGGGGPHEQSLDSR